MGTEGTGLHGLDGQVGVAIGRVRVGAGGRSKVKDGIQAGGGGDELGNILADETECRIAFEAGQVLRIASDEVIHSDDFMAFLQKALAKVGPQKSGCAGDEHAHETLQKLD
jgi:hypothetical protein